MIRYTEEELQQVKERMRGGMVTALPSAGVRRPKSQKQEPSSPFRSKLEASYNTYLEGLKLAGDILTFHYEKVTLKLADDLRYTPDFYVLMKDGREEYHEVKGDPNSMRSKSGMVKLKVAVSSWPIWKFVLVTRRRGAWVLKEM